MDLLEVVIGLRMWWYQAYMHHRQFDRFQFTQVMQKKVR